MAGKLTWTHPSKIFFRLNRNHKNNSNSSNAILDVHINFLQTFVSVCERIWTFKCSEERFINVQNFQYHSFMFNYIHLCTKTFFIVHLHSFLFSYVPITYERLWKYFLRTFVDVLVKINVNVQIKFKIWK